MHQLPNEDLTASVSSAKRAPLGLRDALVEFNLARVHLGDSPQTAWDRHGPSVDAIEREAHLERVMRRIHDALPDAEQLLIHRFFLTAVHRGAVRNESFAPHVMASPERQAARQSEYDELTHEIDDMVDHVAAASPALDRRAARLLAAAFLWSMAWWCHARRDVIDFVDSPVDAPDAVLTLGRRANAGDAISNRIYFEATESEVAYRRHLSDGLAGNNSVRRTASPPQLPSMRFGLPPDVESHM